MRIVSLLPSATESLFALGLGSQVVAVTHECDYPSEAARLPIVTRPLFDFGRASSSDIEREVSLAAERGDSLYEVDTAAIRKLEPDLVIASSSVGSAAALGTAVPDDLAADRMATHASLVDLLAALGVAGGERRRCGGHDEGEHQAAKEPDHR